MGRMYTAVIDGVSIAAISEIFALKAPATACVLVHEVVLTQDTLETSEQLPVTIKRTDGNPDQSVKGTAITPRPVQVGDSAAGTVVGSAILVAATFGNYTATLHRQAQNILGGWHWLFTPESRIVISPSGHLVVKLETAPTAAITVSGYVTFEEIG
jgi:hypothetical protein